MYVLSKGCLNLNLASGHMGKIHTALGWTHKIKLLTSNSFLQWYSLTEYCVHICYSCARLGQKYVESRGGGSETESRAVKRAVSKSLKKEMSDQMMNIFRGKYSAHLILISFWAGDFMILIEIKIAMGREICKFKTGSLLVFLPSFLGPDQTGQPTTGPPSAIYDNSRRPFA